MSTSRVGALAPARRVMQSASTSRPSASVLLTSIVVPSSARTMSPGLDRAVAGQVLGRPDHAEHADRHLELGERGDRLDHRGAAAHVELHVVHRPRRLERQAAGVERDRLADQRESSGRSLLGAS